MDEAREVALVNPISSEPIGASVPSESQHQYPAQRPNIFPMASLGNIPTSAVWTEEVQVSALKKPYPRAQYQRVKVYQYVRDLIWNQLDSLLYRSFSRWHHQLHWDCHHQM